MSSRKFVLLMSAAVLALGACSPAGKDDRLSGQLTPVTHTDLSVPPMDMAGPRGMQNAYFDPELNDAAARIANMETTLGQLQTDLQGTASAMDRVNVMRQELAALNARFSVLREKMSGGPPPVVPTHVTDIVPPAPLASVPGAQTSVTTTTTSEVVPADMPVAAAAAAMNTPTHMAMEPLPATKSTTVTTTTATPAGPTPLMGAMAKPEVKPAPMKPVVDEKKAEAKAESKKEAPKADTKKAEGVNAVRFGTHGETVRIVLDVTGSAEGAKPELVSGENILTISLPKTKWPAASTQKVANNPVVASYSAQPSGEGSVVAFSLKGTTKIVSSSVMKNPTRVVVDLAK